MKLQTFAFVTFLVGIGYSAYARGLPSDRSTDLGLYRGGPRPGTDLMQDAYGQDSARWLSLHHEIGDRVAGNFFKDLGNKLGDALKSIPFGGNSKPGMQGGGGSNPPAVGPAPATGPGLVGGNPPSSGPRQPAPPPVAPKSQGVANANPPPIGPGQGQHTVSSVRNSTSSKPVSDSNKPPKTQ